MADVLVAEDAALQSSLIQSFLQGTHRVVGIATDGVEAVTLTRQTDPDVVVMDIDMPVATGIEATETVKSIDPDIGIVISSIVVQDEVLDQATAAGAEVILQKPYSRDELLDAIEQVT